MAVYLHNADHSLLTPQSFLEDPGALLLPNKSISTTNSWSSVASSSDSGSVLSSPIASEVGSIETESDPDEGFMAQLTRQMAHFMFQDDDELGKSWGSAGSPQSTLWSPLGSKHESPIGLSREPSPPAPIMIEEFEKMKINRDMSSHNNSEVSLTLSKPSAEFRSDKQALINDQIRAIQFYKLKQEQLMKQLEHKNQLKHYQNKGKTYSGFNNCQKTVRPPSSSSSSVSSPWYNMQQQQQTNQQRPGSGMKAMFLDEPGSRTGSCGTGVFLPKGIGYSSESRKKPGCSTVLIPARVVQALKQHFDKVGVPSKFNGKFPVQHDAINVVGNGRNSLYSQQHRQSWTVPAMNHQEMLLPQEWTY